MTENDGSGAKRVKYQRLHPCTIGLRFEHLCILAIYFHQFVMGSGNADCLGLRSAFSNADIILCLLELSFPALACILLSCIIK